MADKKITALTALGTTDVDPAADLLHIIDYSASPVNKKITIANLFDQVNTNTSIYGNSKTFEVGQAAAANSHLRVEVGSSASADGAVTINDDGVAYVDFTVKTQNDKKAIEVDAGADTVTINGDSIAALDFVVKGDTTTLIHADGGEDSVGIGTATIPTGTSATTLTVAADATTGHGINNAGNLVMSGAPGAVVSGGATGAKTVIPLTTSISYLSANTTGSADFFTLGAGVNGQFKTLICTAGAGVCAAKISALGTSMKIGSANGDPTGTALTTLTLGYQEAVLLQFLNSGWSIVGGGIQAAVS
jgi:hypothetical protein